MASVGAALQGPVFLDTSVLVGGLIQLGGPDAPAQRVMDALAEGRVPDPQTAWHCCLEFYSVSTRLPVEYRLRPEDALRLLEEEILERLKVLALPVPWYKPLFRHAVADRIVGGRMLDFHVAAIAHSGGARLVVTENRRQFVSLLRHGVSVLSAAELAERLVE